MHPVLIVDDNNLQQTLYRGVLGKLPIELTQLGTIKAALAAAKKTLFALIIMDIMLPDGSGIDATRQIRKLPGYAATPIIMISTQATLGQEQMLQEAGATRCLAKPVDFGVLSDMLGEYLKVGS
jgi:CheY-like chemotaxis protein